MLLVHARKIRAIRHPTLLLSTLRAPAACRKLNWRLSRCNPLQRKAAMLDNDGFVILFFDFDRGEWMVLGVAPPITAYPEGTNGMPGMHAGGAITHPIRARKSPKLRCDTVAISIYLHLNHIRLFSCCPTIPTKKIGSFSHRSLVYSHWSTVDLP